MDGKDRLMDLWRVLRLPNDAIRACSKDYDLLCPHCRVAGRGDVHLRILLDDSGFRCVGIGHEYRWGEPHVRCVPRQVERPVLLGGAFQPLHIGFGEAVSA